MSNESSTSGYSSEQLSPPSSRGGRGSGVMSLGALAVALSVTIPVGFLALPPLLKAAPTCFECKCETWKMVALALAPLVSCLLTLALVAAPVPTMRALKDLAGALPLGRLRGNGSGDSK